MTNERRMEHWILKDLGIDLTSEENEKFWIYPQGNTQDPLVSKVLVNCGGKPKYCPLTEYPETKESKGRGKPEYIFRHKKSPIVLLVECKTETTNHQSEKLDKPAFNNVDGLLYYAKYLKNEFDVLGLAISGWERVNCKISFFTWPKGEENFNSKSIQKHENIWKIEEYFPIETKSRKESLETEIIRENADKLHDIIYQGLGFSEKEKPFFFY